MKIVFFGTPEFVLPVLTGLHKKYVTGPGKSPIVAVVTQSPKPTGRKQILSYSPIDKWAHDHKIDTYYQGSELVKNEVEADFGVLAAHGEIITKDVINLFPNGILVIHPSLLPDLRGASPIQAAITLGKKTTGVSIIKMDEKIDHGKIVAQFKEDIKEDDTAESLRTRLFDRTNDVLLEMIDPYLHYKIKPREQDEENATFTTKVRKEDAFIPGGYLSEALLGQDTDAEWKINFITGHVQTPSPANIEQFIRAMNPWPFAWTYIRLNNAEGTIRRLKLIKAHLEDTKLVLDEVQLEGKTPTTWKQFNEAYPSSLLSDTK
ncbi:MAG TPA: methionyl-tRNA formyltransferase [Patescibacteria group bacterium]|nr:methionyl-tRNA formyltransferase [Patescibacteria group bacterium]